jgi:hypothetical protein
MKGSVFDFGGRVVSGFQRSQGFLPAGAIAYYTLLAIVPLFVVLLVGLSHVADEHRLLDTVASNLQLVVPSNGRIVPDSTDSAGGAAALAPVRTGQGRRAARPVGQLVNTSTAATLGPLGPVQPVASECGQADPVVRRHRLAPGRPAVYLDLVEPARRDGCVDEHDLRPLGLQSRDGTRAAMSPDGT